MVLAKRRDVCLVLVPLVALSACASSKESGAPGAPEARLASKTAEAEKAEAGGGGSGPAKTWKRSTLDANTSRLMIGDREELPIRGMEVHARVDGFRARVVIDFFFANSSDRQYEGTFKLRLPDGASPYFLAFGQDRFEEPQYIATDKLEQRDVTPAAIERERTETWVEPKIARMVPREQAARAYGDTVRQQIDPALMEWAGAGVFNARIFPIAPRKLHRIVVGYDMNLIPVGGGYELQLPIPDKLPGSSVFLDVATPKGVSVKVAGAQGKRDGERTYFAVGGASGKVVTASITGRGLDGAALTGADQAGRTFAAHVAPALPSSKTGVRPDRAVFAVDTSMSSNPDKMNVWLSLMRAILENNRQTISEFAVVFFNVETHWFKPAFVANTPENVAALIAAAGELALEGATDLGVAVAEAARPSWTKSAKRPHDIFLLSDGAATWGASDRYAISGKLARGRVAALFAYRTGMSGSDTAALEHLARESGGAVFSVVGESEIAAASTAHDASSWRLDSATAAGADVVIAGRPTAVFPGQRLYVAWRDSGNNNDSAAPPVTLTFSQGDRKKTVTIAPATLIASPAAARAYGQIAVDQLEEFVGSTRTFAEAYARHYRVTGKTTSLLMLESEQDYQRHNIRPADDAGVVRRTRATTLVGEALAELAKVLGDPKHAFMSSIELPGAVRDALMQLPASAFDIDVPRLESKAPGWTSVGSGPLRAQLATRRPEYDTVTAAAAARRQAFGASAALRALSSLVEANPGDAVLARDIGFTAMEWGMPAQAVHLFRRVAAARSYEPQTYWALALALADIGKADLALAYFELGVSRDWDARFGEFKRIVMLDYIRFLAKNSDKLSGPVADYGKRRLTELRRLFGVDSADLLVTIMWNTDNTDVDLHIVEPSGEEAFYSHKNTKSGGRMSDDVTQGYGPEMFIHPRAPRGTYHIRAKYFASDSNRASARTKVYATIYQNWGKPNEKVTRKVVTLEYGKEMHELGVVKR